MIKLPQMPQFTPRRSNRSDRKAGVAAEQQECIPRLYERSSHVSMSGSAVIVHRCLYLG